MKDKFSNPGLKKVKSCGILVFRNNQHLSFLLMKHLTRYDLPKGHMHMGETEEQCAFRELVEETGIPRELVSLDRNFRFEIMYYPREFGYRVEKTLVIFLGRLVPDYLSAILPTEHIGFEWVDWNPPHLFNNPSVDPLLAQVELFFQQHGSFRTF